jgi:hypothetical protein
MKIKVFSLLIFCLITTIAYCQPKKEEKSLWDKIYVGGNLGLQFGTTTDVEVSPHIGYYITPRWSAGVGLTYNYYNQAPNYYYKRFETHIYGYNLFTQLSLIPDMGRTLGFGYGISIIGHAELDQISLENDFKVVNPSDEGRFWLTSFYVGGGIRQAVGQRSSIYLLVLWDLNQDLNSYNYNPSNPTLKLGIDF